MSEQETQPEEPKQPEKLTLQIREVGGLYYGRIYAPRGVKDGKEAEWAWSHVGADPHNPNGAHRSRSDLLAVADKEIGAFKGAIETALAIYSNTGWEEIDIGPVKPNYKPPGFDARPPCAHLHGTLSSEEDEDEIPGELYTRGRNPLLDS